MDNNKDYKDAFEKAKMAHGTGCYDDKTLEFIFPQLVLEKEPSDEDIINVILEAIRVNFEGYHTVGGIEKSKIIRWLEKQKEASKAIEAVEKIDKYIDEHLANAHDMKDSHPDKKYYNGWDAALGQIAGILQDVYSGEKQKEQKPANEPKFKVGDWIIDKFGFVQQILDFRGGIYTCTYNSFTADCESNYHLWTIKDAKDGDVLVAENFDNIGGCVFLFKGLDTWKFDAEGDRAVATGYCCISITESGNTDFGIQGPDCVEIKRVHPATKKQRDLLFTKIKEAGYEWSEGAHKLKKIEQKPVEWSEEDEAMIDHIIEAMPQWANGKIAMLPSQAEEYAERLKSLRPQPHTVSIKDATKFGNLEYERGVKDGIQSEKSRHWKPSEEQLKALKTVANAVSLEGLNSLFEDLKKL